MNAFKIVSLLLFVGGFVMSFISAYSLTEVAKINHAVVLGMTGMFFAGAGSVLMFPAFLLPQEQDMGTFISPHPCHFFANISINPSL